MRPAWVRLALRAAFLLALVIVFIVALLPSPEVVQAFPQQDKLGHFVVFMALGIAGLLAWPNRPLAICVVLLAYGMAMEVAQSMTETRHGDPWDWVADAVGVAAALMLHGFWRRRRDKVPS